MWAILFTDAALSRDIRRAFKTEMKPLTIDAEDAGGLQELGRQSLQIVHDIKNQLNGLKLYATFLRKRMERNDRPEDERETIAKLIAGLERATADASALVRLARPIELRRQPRVDLTKVITSLGTQSDLKIDTEESSFQGEFDLAAVTEALKDLTETARQNETEPGALAISLRHARDEATSFAIVEWHGVKPPDGMNSLFSSYSGSNALRANLAAKIIKAHGGQIEHQGSILRVTLPINSD